MRESVVVTAKTFSRHPILRRELMQRYPHVKFNEEGKNLSNNELILFMQGYTKAITALEKIDESLIINLPKLHTISKYGACIDNVDLCALKKYGIKLGWCQGVNKRSVSELTLNLMLNLLRQIPAATHLVKTRYWHAISGRQLSNRVIGIIGCGNIGKDLIKLLKPFNAKILVFDNTNQFAYYATHGITAVSLKELLQYSEIVTVHLPLNSSTVGLLDASHLQLLRRDAILVNTARGGILDEQYVKEMLLQGRLAGAAFDVFATEPPTDQELLELHNFIATPHIGGISEEAILAMGRAAIYGLDHAEVPYVK